MLLMLSGGGALCECRGALRWQRCETGKLECCVGGVVAGCRMHVQTNLHAVTDVLARYSTAVVYRS